jgi:nitric oxide dioxygenase
MLSPSALEQIRASVPVLREHGQPIARHFYAQLFAAEPTLKNLFNLGNQQRGAQQTALSSALLAYAANIENPAALAPVLSRIAHKHASLGVQPAQYGVVAQHLLAAIQAVLGPAATQPLMAAWDEAYWALARALIVAEARLYARAARTSPQTLEVTEVTHECPGVISYYLRGHGRVPGPFEPGQYVSVAVDLPQHGVRQLRQYSLSDANTRPYWRITVKREEELADSPAGWVSNHLHKHVHAGSRLQVSPAFGDFVPLSAADSSRPLALLSAGVGITPMMSVLNTLAETGNARRILFAHAARDGERQAFRRELARAEAQLPSLSTLYFHEISARDSARPGRMQLDAALLAGFEDADFYLCGPLPFMHAQWRTLVGAGISPLRIHREVFGPELFDHLA